MVVSIWYVIYIYTDIYTYYDSTKTNTSIYKYIQVYTCRHFDANHEICIAKPCCVAVPGFRADDRRSASPPRPSPADLLGDILAA